MAKSKITGKTFDEMLSESTELDLSAKFKDIIYEFSNDVHAMGIVVYTYEEGSAKFLFKDPDFTKPITDYELLAMYLDEVVATRLIEGNTALERCRDLENEKVQYYEYKDENFIKRFYKIGEYYSGETYNDLNGFVPGGMPLVGTAIVGVDKVAENEPVPMQTIWEGTFDTTYSEDVGGNYYTTQDIQNGELIKNCNEVTVTFDGATYALPVEQTPFGYGVGDDVEPSSDCPFTIAFMVESPSSAVLKSFAIFTLTDGEHTLKIECPAQEESESTALFEASFHIDDTAEDSYYCFDESVPSEYGTAPGLQDIMQITSLNEVKVTFDGNEFTVPISSNPKAFYPSYSFGDSKENGFNAILFKWKPSSVSDYYDRLDIWTYSDGDHTIKVETV